MTEPPILGYMVHTGDPRNAALYNLSQHSDAEDAARRWGASITAITVCQGAPLPMTPSQEARAWVDVLAERRRQVEAEGWTAEHDDEHDSGEMASAASAYALAAADKLHPMSQGDGEFDKLPPAMWPWDYEWWKPGEPRRMLVKAGALILAEIERLDRAAIAKGASQP